MTDDNTPIIQPRSIPDMLIASIRFMGQADEIPVRLAQLTAEVGHRAIGNPILLFTWGHATPELDVEVCLPVDQPVNAGLVSTRVLPGGQMLTLQHRGPYTSLPDGWRRLSAYLREHRVGWGNGPGREVYLEGPETHGSQEERYLTEIQAPMLLPEWIGHLADGVDRLQGAERASYVVGDGRSLAPNTTPRVRALWVQGMLRRLEEVLPGEEQQHAVLSGCSHVFPQRRVEQLRARYQADGNLDDLLAFMGADRTENGRCYYETPRREANVIRVTKIPFDGAAFEVASTRLDRQLAYCHCPMVKDALREGLALSPAYCHCGAGWYHTLWEGILGRPVRVDTLRSLLNGDETCEFAIHID